VKLYAAKLTFTQLHFLGTVSPLKRLVGTFRYYLSRNLRFSTVYTKALNKDLMPNK